MIPEFPQFKKLELSDKKDIEKFTSKFFPYSDFNFVSMWSWNIKDEMQVSQMYGNLIVCFTDYLTSEPFYSFLGDNNVNETTEILLELSKKKGFGSKLKLIPEDSIKNLDKGKFSIKEDRNNFDYIVSIDKLKPHDGKIRKLSSRRKLIIKLKQLSDLSVIPIDLNDSKITNEILRVFSEWEAQRGIGVEETHHLRISIERAFKLGNQKDTISLGAFANGRLVGYTINGIVGNGYALGNFQQADLKYSSGIYALLMQEAGIYLDQLDCKYLNLEQDLGIEGLKRWKLSYSSTTFFKKYIISNK